MIAETTGVHGPRADSIFRALVAVSVVLYTVAVYDNLAHGFISISSYSFALHLVALFVLTPSVLLVSALIIWRVPGNNVGRYLVLLGLGSLGWQYSYQFDPVQVGILAKTLFYIFWFGLAFPALIYLMLSFPTGHIYPPDWARWVLLLGIVKFVGVVLEIGALKPGDPIFLLISGNEANLISIAALRPFSGIIATTIGSNGLLMLVGVLAGFASLVLRYRASGGRERQQIKWVVWSFAILTLAAIFIALVTVFGYITDPTAGDATGILFFAAIFIVILSLGVSILRYHLFDIDVIIRRTVTYAILGALLLVVYFGSVILLQQLFASVTGQRSEVITVLSTLGIAALFVPLRNRIQGFIDRRFYRKKYDAQQVLSDFAKTVRDETDLDKLAGRLMEVVNETMQPKSVSVWLNRRQSDRIE